MDVRSELSGRRSKKRTARPKGISEQILSEDYWEGYYALGDSTVVKCIDAEDKRKPLTDDQLVDEMTRRGYKVARRTIAKYRDMLNIPKARLRKEL